MNIIEKYQKGKLYLDELEKAGYLLEFNDEFVDLDGSECVVIARSGIRESRKGDSKRKVIKSAQLDREIEAMGKWEYMQECFIEMDGKVRKWYFGCMVPEVNTCIVFNDSKTGHMLMPVSELMTVQPKVFIMVNGHKIYGQLTERPELGKRYWFISLQYEEGFDSRFWQDYLYEENLFKRGLCFENEEDATVMAKALLDYKKD